MTEISGIEDRVTVDNYGFSEAVEKKKEEPAIAEEPAVQVPTGESEKILKAQEALHRAVAPNLRNLDREQEIKIQLRVLEPASKRFPLLMELFKIKFQALKREQPSMDEFIQEIESRVKKNDFTFTFDGENGDLKTEVFGIYGQLFMEAENMRKEIRPDYSSPYLQLFELEKEIGFPLCGTELLAQEAQAYSDIFIKLAKGGIDINTNEFYRGTAFVGYQKILLLLEKEGKNEMLQNIVNFCILPLYFHPASCKCKTVSIKDASQDPMVHLFPYVVKYASLNQIKDYFNQRYKDLTEWDKAYQWIDLHCAAAEILAPIDQKKSAEYLEMAEKEMKAKLWAYLFSSNRTAIEEKRKLAEIRIAEAKAKINNLNDSLKDSGVGERR